MKQKESILISTAMIGCSWKKQFAKRHLVLRGNAPYVISVKAVRIGREPAEATAGGDLRYVPDNHACAQKMAEKTSAH
jgi:hypothetical protein